MNILSKWRFPSLQYFGGLNQKHEYMGDPKDKEPLGNEGEVKSIFALNCSHHGSLDQLTISV